MATGLQLRRWSRAEYHRAAEVGLFRPDERLELLEGEIIRKMSPQGEAHAAGVGLCADALQGAFGSGFHVREEKPLVLSDRSEPEPDVVVVRGARRELTGHPTPADAVLVVEVSDTTLAFDQGDKAAAYARSGIADYWILDLRHRRLEIRRSPGQIASDEYGYRTLELLTPGMTAFALAAPNSPISVDDLFPTSLPGAS